MNILTRGLIIPLIHLLVLSILVLPCISPGEEIPSLANINVDDWIEPLKESWEYRALEHLSARGFFQNGYTSMRPISVRRMSLLLKEAFVKIEEGKELDSLDKYYLKRLIELYLPEDNEIPEKLKTSDTRVGYRPGNLVEKTYGPHIKYRGGVGLSTEFDVWNLEYTPSYSDRLETINTEYNISEEFDFQGSADISDRIVIAGRVRMKIFSEKNWVPSHLTPEYATGKEFKRMLISDEQGYLTGDISIFEFQIGRDKLVWGGGYHSDLLISQNSPSFDMFKMTMEWDRITFQSFTALLDPSTETYLSGHRFEARILRWLNMGYTEVVYYAEQGPVWYYLNPFLPYFFIQWNTKDKDNVFIQVDGEVHLPDMRIYGAFMIDDYHWTHINFGPPQKTGYQIGVHWANPFKIPASDLRFEYTRVNPGTYAHFFDKNIYLYKDRHIGYYQGTDADDLFIEFSKVLYPGFRVFGQFIYERKGEMTVYDTPPHDWEQWIDLPFPTGVVQKGKIFGFGFEGMPLFWRFDCGLNGEYLNYKNWENVQGNDETGFRIYGGLRLNL